MDIAEIIRARLNDGRTISDDDVRQLLTERDALLAAQQTARRNALEAAEQRVQMVWDRFRERDEGSSNWIFETYDDIPTGDDFAAAIRQIG
jgi:single-stranded DNA-specific DHH superfamily exonuclease